MLTPRRLEENLDILVDEGKLVLGETDKSGEVVDCSGKLVLPGLINTHTHAAMSLFRGISDDLPLEKWLKEKIWPLESKLNEKYVYYGTLLAAIEMIRSGTVCFNDMYFFGTGVKKAVEEVGIRCVFSQAVLDFPTAEFDNQNEAFKIFKNLDGSELFVPAIGVHSIYTCSQETLLRAKDIAEKYGSLIHIHLSETENEVKGCLERNGCRPVEYLERIGFLSSDVIAAHCVWVSEKELDILKRFDVKISHCPSSNLKLASGVSPVPEMVSRGLVVSLGTDSAVSNNSLNLFEEMKIAAILHKRKDPTVLPAHEVFEMATLRAAESLGLGSSLIETGRRADLVLIDLKEITMRPFHDLVSNLVYSFNGRVSDVIINGKIIMKDCRITTVDE
ncbi:MAG: amidohydrolase, partial [Candidatus Micrarchaeota archaeon]|nr:amidohydrolase [Candidatus Micrarchaeota archaeon]